MVATSFSNFSNFFYFLFWIAIPVVTPVAAMQLLLLKVIEVWCNYNNITQYRKFDKKKTLVFGVVLYL